MNTQTFLNTEQIVAIAAQTGQSSPQQSWPAACEINTSEDTTAKANNTANTIATMRLLLDTPIPFFHKTSSGADPAASQI